MLPFYLDGIRHVIDFGPGKMRTAMPSFLNCYMLFLPINNTKSAASTACELIIHGIVSGYRAHHYPEILKDIRVFS